MGFPSGKKLTALSLALILAAAAAAVRIGLSGELRAAAREVRSGGDARLLADNELSLARDAERRGDVACALARYRKAAEIRPGLVDRYSPDFLGPGFEKSLKGWVSALKRGRAPAGASALEDASFLFRRMYGGCG